VIASSSDTAVHDMELVRVFNNNVVLARDDAGRDVILTGRGLGFQARPGQSVDPAQIVRIFVPADGRDPDHLAQLLAGIPRSTLRWSARLWRTSGWTVSPKIRR
jgi:CAT RNA binding domain